MANPQKIWNDPSHGPIVTHRKSLGRNNLQKEEELLLPPLASPNTLQERAREFSALELV